MSGFLRLLRHGGSPGDFIPFRGKRWGGSAFLGIADRVLGIPDLALGGAGVLLGFPFQFGHRLVRRLADCLFYAAFYFFGGAFHMVLVHSGSPLIRAHALSSVHAGKQYARPPRAPIFSRANPLPPSSF